jgi:hypothetical protein
MAAAGETVLRGRDLLAGQQIRLCFAAFAAVERTVRRKK